MESPRRNSDSSALTDVSFNDDMSAASASPETQTKTSQENDSSPQTFTSPSLSDYLLSLELQVVLEDEELEDEKKDVVEFTILEYFQADEIDFSQLLVKIYGMDDKKALQQIMESDENKLTAIHHAAQHTAITDTLFRELLRIVEKTEESRQIFSRRTTAGDTILHLLAEEHILLTIARFPGAVLAKNKLGHQPIHSAQLLEQDGTSPSEIRDNNPLICAVLVHAEKCLLAAEQGDCRGTDALNEMCPYYDMIELCRRRNWSGVNERLRDKNLHITDLFKSDSTTYNCLHHAVWGHAPFLTIEKMIEVGKIPEDEGGDILLKTITSNGRTALHLACMVSDDVLLIKHLIRLFPNPLVDMDHKKAGQPLKLAKKCYTNRHNHKRIVEIVQKATDAMEEGDYDTIRELCPLSGLLELVFRKDWKACTFFINDNTTDNGSDSYLKDECLRKDDVGYNCLHYLVKYRGPTNLIRQIIKTSKTWIAQIRFDPGVFNPPMLSITTTGGFTPLHVAALYAIHPIVFKTLVLEYPLALAMRSIPFQPDPGLEDQRLTPYELFLTTTRPRINADEIGEVLKNCTEAFKEGNGQRLHTLCVPPSMMDEVRQGLPKTPRPLTVKDYQTKLASTTKELDQLKTKFDEVTRCCVCWVKEREVIFKGCFHRCCCTKCAQKLSKCPLCRTKIKGKIKSIG
ncbi:hypothetical protein TrLO_g1115 [Triparma laevis f. longispina]|uniref:RING-type domain-containing protein n=1 Tax=Triparma laevis f. longispina TaxID=1714387 RepID=A0A9W7F308_9STRA|nr:hypothetical protein TrLO_g1115 [Triparma laevis f. longispina]